MEALICKHYLVSGRVQGVFFRSNTCKKAKEFDLTGWVKNLPDGRVELLACGSLENLQALEAWLWQGPTIAKVDEVIVMDRSYEIHAEFIIL
jgi:acylphosphatase